MSSRRPVDVVLAAARTLAIPAVLLFLVAGSVTWAVNDPGLYRNGFQRYHTAQRSGISDPDLVAIGAELRRYFNTSAEPLAVRAPIYGIEQEVFNRREVAHMYDVKRLVRGTYWVAVGSALWILGTVAILIAADRRTWPIRAARLAVWGGSITLTAVFLVGLAAVASFEQLFLLFHRLSFANDLWMLDPRTDYLLILFPAGFWFDATMRVALTSVLGAALLLSAGVGSLSYRRWSENRRRDPDPTPADTSAG
ncbi:MAG: TIGR01906 family membrane protein [Chloroflexota bacterium]|nr:TIGR01906 family membrane protein [Chloroflexota bacterium]MDE2959727.1 TIGR01906 family membrane protein [Chloroflexota bacterium]